MKKYISVSSLFLIGIVLFLFVNKKIHTPIECGIIFLLFLPILYGFLYGKKKIAELEKEAEKELHKQNKTW